MLISVNLDSFDFEVEPQEILDMISGDPTSKKIREALIQCALEELQGELPGFNIPKYQIELMVAATMETHMKTADNEDDEENLEHPDDRI